MDLGLSRLVKISSYLSNMSFCLHFLTIIMYHTVNYHQSGNDRLDEIKLEIGD